MISRSVSVILFAALVASCSSPSTEIHIPASLGGLVLTKETKGDEAQSIINRLHDKSVTPDANSIGHYQGDDGEAVLYASIFESEAHAVKAENRMIDMIKPGHAVFGHYQYFDIEGKNVSMCLGMGQAHFFFSHRNYLYWLAVDMPISERTLIHLLHVVQREETAATQD